MEVKKKYWTITEILTNEFSPSTTFILSNGTVLWSHEQFNEYMLKKYGSFFYCREINSSVDWAINLFQTSFNMFKVTWIKNADIMYNTLNAEYEPLDTYHTYYDGKEIIEKHKGNKTTLTGSDSDTYNTTETDSFSNFKEKTDYNSSITVTENGSETLEKHKGNKVSTGSDITESKNVNGFNSSTAVPDSSIKTSGSASNNFQTTQDISANEFDKDKHIFDNRSTTTAKDGDDTKTISGSKSKSKTGTVTNQKNLTTSVEDVSSTKFDKDVKNWDNFHGHGSTGVYTAQTLIKEELELRMKNYIYELMDLFAKENLFYVDGLVD